MGEEKGRRRRGHRRGRDRPPQPPATPPREQAEGPPEISEESDAPGVLPPRLKFWSRRSGAGRQQPGDDAPPGKERQPDRADTSAGPSDVSPLGFWRRGRARTYRQAPMPKQTLGRTLRRVQGLHVPPWMPVVFIIFVVFALLGGLFIVQGATGAPRVGKDHWHSTYRIFICGQRQPNVRNWGDGKTHDDGVIHTHPNLPTEEGSGSRLVKWFEYGGGKLTQSEMRIPGNREVYRNGDKCDDGREATLQVFVNDEKLDNWRRYLPQDGDRLRIVFGPEETEPVQEEDRTIIAEGQATRTLEVEISGGEADAAFSPPSIELTAGETVKLAVRNTGTISHGFRVAGPDGEYDTSDDYVSDPEIIAPGAEATVVVQFDKKGEFEFRDPTIQQAVGTIVVQAKKKSEQPGETQAPEVKVDVTFDVDLADNVFKPAKLEVKAGQTFRINLRNSGEFIHNLHIAGPDDEFENADDIESEPLFQKPDETGVLVGQIDEPGVYRFRCDFHPAEMVGTITVK